VSFEISSHSLALLSQEGSAIEDGARGGSEGKHARVLPGNPHSRDFDYAARPLRLIALSPGSGGRGWPPHLSAIM
jgi:hypothetical protein